MFNFTEMDDIAYETTRYDRLEWNNFLSFFKDEVDEAKSILPKEFSDEGYHYEMNVLSREVFARMFNSSDKKVIKTDMVHANEIHEALTNLHEFQNVRHATRGKWELSGAFTLGFMTTLASQLDFSRCAEIAIEDGEEIVYKRTRGQHSEVKMRNILRKSIEDGEEMVEIFKEMGNFLGAGKEDSEPKRMDDIRKMMKSRHKDTLRKIAKAIGRLKHVMNAATTKRAIYAKSEVYGVKLGKEFQNLTSSEFGKLACGGAIAAEVMGRVISGNALQMAHRGKQKEGMGPILVYVDGSGSMDTPFRGATAAQWAMALGVTLSLAADKQKREFYMAPFSREIVRKYELKTGFKTDDILRSVEFYPGGGTMFGPCAQDAINRLSEKTYKKADIVMVTDGDAEDYAQSLFDKAKKMGARLHLIKIGNYNYKTQIDSYSDTISVLKDSDNENDTEELFASVMKEN